MDDAPISKVPLADIEEPPHQLRQHIDHEGLGELADSMATEGLHQPIGVTRATPGPGYVVVWGHRRLLAARMLQWTSIPAKVLPDGADVLQAATSENMQRLDLTPVEEALTIRKFLARGESRASIARRFRRSPGWVNSRVELLDYPSDVQDAVAQKHITLAVAGLLATVDHDQYRQELIRQAREHGASEATAMVWAAHYAQDRTRIVQNHETITDIIQARDKYIIKYSCDGCGAEVPYAQTRTLRLCLQCFNDIEEATRATPEPIADTPA